MSAKQSEPEGLVEVTPENTVRLPSAMVDELGRRIWFLRGKERWEAFSEQELETMLSGSEFGDCFYTLEEVLRRMAWDFAEWSHDPPLKLTGQEQREIAIILNDAANMIDMLRGGER